MERTNTTSGSSLKYSKILQEPFLIVKNHVDLKNFHSLCAGVVPMQCLSDFVILVTPLDRARCTAQGIEPLVDFRIYYIYIYIYIRI